MASAEAGSDRGAASLCRRLIELGIALGAEPELSVLLDRVLGEARRCTDAEAGTVFLREGDRLRFAVAHNDVLAERLGEREVTRRLESCTVPVGGASLAGYVAASGQALLVPDVRRIRAGAPYAFDTRVDDRTTYRTRSVLAVPLLDPAGEALGVLQLLNARHGRGGVAAFASDQLDLVRCLAAHAAIAVRAALLEELSHRDPLTGLYNRRYFTLRVQEEGKRHERSGEPVSLALLDIDHFKPVNDRLGHAAGDELLRELAQVLTGHSRAFSIITRYGGDEFAVLLVNTPKAGAIAYARRIKRLIESHAFAHGSLTVSLGVASLPDDVSAAAGLLAAADRALYLAKRGGGNSVEVA